MLSGRSNDSKTGNNPFNEKSESNPILSMNPLSGTYTPVPTPKDRSEKSHQNLQKALTSLSASFKMPNLEMAPESN